MRIVCPKCELKGQVDVASASAKTRIACVRCATTFDAIYIDGQIQALLPQASHVEMALESVGSDAFAATAPETPSPVETQQESQLDFASQLESAPAPADNFLTSSMEMALDESLETSSPVLPQETANESAGQSVPGAPEAQEMPDGQQTASALETPPKFVGAGKTGQPSDAYGLGVRLMRVSPMWLLLAGLSFISFIVLCNWLIKPDATNVDAARMLVADNHATNGSPSRVVPPNSTALSTVNSQAAPSGTQPGVAFIPTEAKEANAPKAATPGAKTIEQPAAEVKPAVAEKSASPASPSNGASAAQGGRVTIQIGSYNEAAQAEERVATLRSAGYEARSVAVEIPKRGTWYRVQSGRFVDRDEAERYGKQLREKGVVSNFITTDVQE
ncbi:MAG TPA: SPOR domain-containing protein [Pyrinomonadaceae bacterium]|jgi:cell division septation protein DedD|nr:SPOR domain-containing protein [Pyrinomonadaceae bacterium]